MKNSRNIIDFEIIWKKINKAISEEEELYLNKWLSESPKHQRFFKSAEQYYEKGSQFENIPVELKKSWKIVSKHSENRRAGISRFVTVVSTAAASVIIIFSLFYFTNKEFFNQSIVQNKQVIKPGTDKAVLILDDGTVHDLSNQKEFFLKEGASTIKSTGDKIEYVGQHEEKKELKYNTLKVPRGGEFYLVLSDGTKVWLNSETTLRYPVFFPDDERKVELIGEAYFEVEHNAKSPFLVSSDDQVIKVLGTQFNVMSYKNDPFIYTTLVNGEVEVSLKNNPEIKKILYPNEQSTIEKGNNFIEKKLVDVYALTAWKDGRFVFQDKVLSDIMKTLSMWYDVEVVFQDIEKKNMRFTGNLPRYSNFEDVLYKIGKTNEVEFIIENERITIL